MKNALAIRARNGLFNFVLFFTTIQFVLVWLPLLRCLFDGSSYRWGQGFYGLSFASRGVEPDILFLVVLLVFFLALFYSFYWIENRKIFYGLLAGWWLIGFGNFIFEILKNGDVMFHGDTLDVHVSLSAIVVPISIIAMAVIIWVIRKDQSMAITSTPWSRRNRLTAYILLAPLPIQAILFMSGEPHGTTDEIGVIITIIQAILFPLIFIPQRGNSGNE